MDANKASPQDSDHSPIPNKKKRQSINSSGVWDVEVLETSLKIPHEQKKNNFKPFPQRKQAGNMKTKPYQSKSPVHKQNKRASQNPRSSNEIKNPLKGWSNNNLIQLVSRVESVCADCLSSEYSESKEKIDWSQVSFGVRTAAACEEAWDFLFNKARSPKELLQRARKLLLEKMPRDQKSEEERKSQNASPENCSNLTDEKSNTEDKIDEEDKDKNDTDDDGGEEDEEVENGEDEEVENGEDEEVENEEDDEVENEEDDEEVENGEEDEEVENDDDDDDDVSVE